MKTLILSLSIAAIFAACSNPQTADTTAEKKLPDTAGLAAYNQWKAQQDAFSMEAAQSVQTQEVPYEDVQPAVEKPKQVIVYRNAPAPKAKAAPVQPRSIAKAPTPVRNTPERVATTRNDIPDPSPSSGDNSSSGAGVGTGNSDAGTGSGDVASAPKPAEKKGWSKAAQGTAIGGASGAVVGAVISKNKAAGAVIGGVVGAAGGYILGRKQDKKDGRY